LIAPGIAGTAELTIGHDSDDGPVDRSFVAEREFLPSLTRFAKLTVVRLSLDKEPHDVEQTNSRVGSARPSLRAHATHAIIEPEADTGV
jgi:hypothetical protein